MKFRFITVGVERITSSRSQEMFKTIDVNISDEYLKEFDGRAILGVEYIPEERPDTAENPDKEAVEPEVIPPAE